MKKLIALLLVVVFVSVGVIGCGGESPKKDTAPKAPAGPGGPGGPGGGAPK